VTRSPVALFAALAALSVLSAVTVITLAVRVPWLGVTLAPSEAATGLAVVSAREDGPAAALSAGDRIVGLSGGAGGSVPLRPVDLIEEPDGLTAITEMRDLFRHQGQIVSALSTGPVTLEVEREGRIETLTVTPTEGRPPSDLPAVFWVQLFVGLAAVWLGGWVLAMRGRDAAAGFLALAGIGLMASSHAAALYSTRELAMPALLFEWASAINSLGSLTFGIAMICLFLVYPVRYLPRWAPLVPVAVFGTWAALSFLRLTGSTAMMIHIPILAEMLGILLAAGGQVFATRGNPSARAALRWFGLSVTLGAGSFVGLIALPQALGYTPQISQGHAFALFLIIYAGLAIGVARFRLFDLEFWAFRVLFYAGGVALLLVLDAGLIYAVSVDRVPAFSISLLVVAFLYLPARDKLARVMSGRREVGTDELFDLVSDVALAPRGETQREKLNELLRTLFRPLEITAAPAPVDEPRLADGGEVLDLPSIDGLSATRMRWAHRGRRLFSPRDVTRVRAVLAMAAQFIERRRAYEAGAEEERQRINRDMHDNIGVQLLGALHSQEPGRKDALIRQTLTDLREIVSHPGGDDIGLQDLLADIRAEVGEHLGSADIALDWAEGPLPADPVAPHVANSVRAILREGAGNVLRHAGARRVAVSVTARPVPAPGRLVISIADDGRGFDPGSAAALPRPRGSGNGLVNLRQRTEARGGTFAIGRGPDGQGTELRAELVLDQPGSGVTALRDAGE